MIDSCLILSLIQYPMQYQETLSLIKMTFKVPAFKVWSRTYNPLRGSDNKMTVGCCRSQRLQSRSPIMHCRKFASIGSRKATCKKRRRISDLQRSLIKAFSQRSNKWNKRLQRYKSRWHQHKCQRELNKTKLTIRISLTASGRSQHTWVLRIYGLHNKMIRWWDLLVRLIIIIKKWTL